MTKPEQVILCDADVISHFITADEVATLPTIFKLPLKMLDQVYQELLRFPKKKQYVESLITDNMIELMPFPDDPVVVKEYLYIKNKRFRGDGESACMAVARYNKHILASSNLKDIAEYCKMHKVYYLTTMDFLCRALETKIFDVERCNKFITAVLSNNSKLPVKKMEDYKCKTIDFC